MINSATQTASDNTAAGSAAKAAGAGETTTASGPQSDYQSFLKLLTAQLRNQDPLSPLDSSEFVAQLATFSSVEQQIEMNKKLDALVSGLNSSTLETAAQWIGREVEVANRQTRFSGDPVTFGVPDNDVGADQIEIVVSDAYGNPVFADVAPASATSYTWEGKTADGDDAPSGDYSVSLSYLSDGESIASKSPVISSRVAEARLEDGEIALILDSGAEVRPDNVLAIREAKVEEDADS